MPADYVSLSAVYLRTILVRRVSKVATTLASGQAKGIAMTQQVMSVENQKLCVDAKFSGFNPKIRAFFRTKGGILLGAANPSAASLDLSTSTFGQYSCASRAAVEPDTDEQTMKSYVGFVEIRKCIQEWNATVPMVCPELTIECTVQAGRKGKKGGIKASSCPSTLDILARFNKSVGTTDGEQLPPVAPIEAVETVEPKGTAKRK